MKKILTIIFILISINTISFAKGIEVPDYIRVGLFSGSSAKSSVKLSSPGGIEIGTMSESGKFTHEDDALKNEVLVVKKGTSAGSVQIEGYGEFGSTTEFPYFKSLESNGVCIIEIDGKKYRGNVEIKRTSSSDMTIINHLSMQEYLYGVVPREIGGNSELEAVKAQAIVARTYAAKNYEKRIKLGFNVYPTTDDQAYGGYEWETKNSNKAVDETDGMVVTYNGDLIGGYYYSTSGGYTEASENVWGGTYPYLKAVPDPYEIYVEGNTTWEVTYTADEIKQKLKSHNINVGDIVDLKILETAESGRVTKLKVVGTAGEEILTKSNTRTFFDLKSQWYTINDEAPKVPNGKTKQENKKIEDDEESEVEVVVEKAKTETKQEEKTEADENAWYLNFETEKSGDVKLESSNGISTLKRDYSKNDALSKTVSNDDNAKTTESRDKKEDINNDDKVEEKTSGDNELNNIDEEEVISIPSGDEDTQNIVINLKGRKSFLLELFETILGLNKEKTIDVQTLKRNYKAGSSKTVFVFRGRGWGHGIGMSQNGAKGMAKEGFSAEEILKWYYSGVEVEKY